MKSKQTSSIDGFVPRRSGSRLGELHANEKTQSTERSIYTSAAQAGPSTVGVARPTKGIGRRDIDDSLREIDDPIIEGGKKSRRQRRKEGLKAPKSKARRITKWVLIALLVIGLGVGGYLIYNLVNNGSKVLQGNIFDIVKNEPLKEDANGRSNFIVFGTAEDDEGGTHGGANLTDSIMVLSISQTKNDAYMISLPRDLWVEYQEQCTYGDQGKLNVTYTCGSDNGNDEAAGAAALQAKAGEILGLDIQYYIHLNFTAVTQAVDAVGGVDVTIDSTDDRGILDRNFDWKCNFTCYYVNYTQGQRVHLDGEHALALARARNAAGGYGVNDNFGRERNQQAILKAMREKALSAGTLANPLTITNLMNALGNNLRTNVQTKEVQTLAGLASDIPSESIIQLSLVEEGNMLVMNGTQNAQSIVRPVAGLLDYSEIIAYVNKNVNSTAITREEPHVSVLNGGRAAGVAQTEADTLTDQGFTVDSVDNAPDGTYAKVEIYQINSAKTASAAKLEELYGVKAKTTAPPASVVGDTDFLIILGPES